MTVTITHLSTGTARTVVQVLGYESTRAVDTIVHTVLGRGPADFTLKPAGPRTGTFELLTVDETDASALTQLLIRPGAFTLSDTDTNMADTTFTPTGPVTYRLDTQTYKRVIVSTAYTEAV